jgi:S-adenosyl methyltransferase
VTPYVGEGGTQGVSERRSPQATMAQRLSEIDTSIAHASRMYDYLLGGTNNFAVDRAAAEEANAEAPGGMAAARAGTRANRAFLSRAVRQLADAGIRQFLDIGAGIPHGSHVHEIAQKVRPEARVVYVDNDPIVLAHSHALMNGTDEGATDFVSGDVCNPDVVLSDASATLDLAQPTAILLVAVLHFIPDDRDPWGIVRRLCEAVPRGSYIAISHGTIDTDPAAFTALTKRLSDRSRERFVWRRHDDVLRFFDGLDLLDPGLVPVNRWRPDPEGAQPADLDVVIHGGVARIP